MAFTLGDIGQENIVILREHDPAMPETMHANQSLRVQQGDDEKYRTFDHGDQVGWLYFASRNDFRQAKVEKINNPQGLPPAGELFNDFLAKGSRSVRLRKYMKKDF